VVRVATVGAGMASRRHRHSVGWLLATGLTMVVDLGVNGYVRYGVVVVRPGSLPSPRWRWWARVAAAGPVLELLSAAIGNWCSASRPAVESGVASSYGTAHMCLHGEGALGRRRVWR
jgi:hypothetical protein